MITCEFENGNKAKLRHAVVDTIVIREHKILLGKRGTLNGKPLLESGKWSLLGGYVNRDEDLSEATKREVMEEAGLKISNLKLICINDNPNRPAEDRQNISFVFVAEAIDNIGENDEEVSELQWFDLNELPPKEKMAFDHLEGIELYKKYLREKFNIPIIKGRL